VFEDPLARAVFANTRVPRRINAEKSGEAYQSIGESPPKVSNCISEESHCSLPQFKIPAMATMPTTTTTTSCTRTFTKKQKKHGSDNKDNKDAFSRRDQHQQSKLTAAETAISDPTRNLNLPTESN
jgi:hypothetical protein